MKNRLFLFIIFCFIVTPWQLGARTYMVTVEVKDYPGEDRDLTKYSSSAAASIESAYRKQDSTLVCTRLVNQQATSRNIISAIKTLFARVDTGDIVIVFINGHGYDGGFCSYDGYLSYTQLREAIAGCKSKHKMIFVDSCHSGSLRSKAPKEKQESKMVKDSANRFNVMLFLSSRDEEYSWATTRYNMGFFTAYLCKAFDGEADINGDKTVTARELYLFVKEGVVKETTASDCDVQHPVMWGNFSDSMPVIHIK